MIDPDALRSGEDFMKAVLEIEQAAHRHMAAGRERFIITQALTVAVHIMSDIGIVPDRVVSGLTTQQ